MRRAYIFILTMLLLLLASCAKNEIRPSEDFISGGSEDENYVELSKVHENVWVHTSYMQYEGSRTPSNGMVVLTSKGAVLIDTPWTNEQTKELMRLMRDNFNEEIKLAIITHAHIDRIGGIDTLLENKIDVRSTELTEIEAEKYGFAKPEPTIELNSNIKFGDTDIEVFYPGAGHTVDNIVVWLPEYKILFGGCLVKSMISESLGNIGDADLSEWPQSIQKVKEKYTEAEVVIPGHGRSGGTELIEHTLELFDN